MKDAILEFLIDLKNYAVETLECLKQVIEIDYKNNYPIYFEIATLIFYCFGFCNKYYLYFLIFVNLLILTYQDIKYKMVYSPYSIMILLFAIFANPHFTVSRVIGILFFPLFFYILQKFIGQFIGDGDIELIAVLGALLGIGNLMCVMLFAALFAGAFIGCFHKKSIPLVPFITFGFVETVILIIVSL